MVYFGEKQEEEPQDKPLLVLKRPNPPRAPLGARQLDGVDFKQLTRDLSAQLNRPQPMTWVGKWLENKKLPHDNERVRLLTEYVDKVRMLNESVNNVRNEIMMSPVIVEGLIRGVLLKQQLDRELMLARHQAELTKISGELKEAKLRRAEIKAGIFARLAEVRLSSLRGDLIEKIIEEADLKHLTAAEAYIIEKALNPSVDGKAYNPKDEMLREEDLRKAQLENDRTLTQIKRERAQAEAEWAASLRTIKDYGKTD